MSRTEVRGLHGFLVHEFATLDGSIRCIRFHSSRITAYRLPVPELSALIARSLQIENNVWLKDVTKLDGLLPFVDDKAFQVEWVQIKLRYKERLALGIKVNTEAMSDVQIKVRCFYVVQR
jgi:glucan phosphorylase